MKRQMKAMLYFFGTDMRYSFIIFWSILSVIIVLSMIAAFFLLHRVEDAVFYLALSVSVYVYGAVLGFKTVKDSLGFSLKLGATRRNYFASIGAYFVFVAILSACIETLMHQLVTMINQILSLDTFYLIHPAAMLGLQDSIFGRFLVDAAILFFLLVTSFLLGLIFYKYNLAVGFSVIGALFLLVLITAAEGMLFELISKIVVEASILHYLTLFLVTMACYLISWFLIRNISVKSARES